MAQSTRPSSELPGEVQVVLDQVEDFSFSFAQPGFYAVLEHVRMTSSPLGQAHAPLEIDDWVSLLERPADFRGLAVTIEGIVGRNTNWRFEQEEHRHLGQVWQLELWRADQPIAATLILTEDAGDIPIGATIRATGYFVMIRQYYSVKNRVRQAALVIGRGPTLVSRPVARTPGGSSSGLILGGTIAGVAALLVTWLLLRRSVARTRHASRELRASSAAPISLAEELAEWAAEQPDQMPADADNGADQT